LRLQNRKASGETQAAAETLRALREIESVVEAAGREAALTPELLAALARSQEGEEGESRKSPAAVENACRWFAADSFGELNPVEQAAISCLRFLELEPFERKGERIALLSASLFTLRGTLPPVIIKPDQVAAFRAAAEEGFRMNTKPMVEVIGEAVAQSLDEMIRIAEA
jgi:hypothetical protein